MRTWMVLLLLCALCVTAQAYPLLADSQATYRYQSQCDSNGYVWYLRNESSDQSITSWTWAGGFVGDVPGVDLYGDEFPLLPITDYGRIYWYYAVTSDTSVPITVPSTITWADGSTATVPIYMPTAVPEPAGLLVLAAGVGGLLLRRKRCTL